MQRNDHRLGPLLVVIACVTLSGAASLGLEVVWSRLLKLVFGSTTLAVTTILVAYMLGLGIGGLCGGRLAARLRNGVTGYGVMEIAVGLYALVVPAILGVFPVLDRGLLAPLGFWPAALLRFAAVLLVLLPPTFMMGATLPVLAVSLVRERGRVAARIGLLYGFNTLGAVAGALLVTFVLFDHLGVHGTGWLCAGGDLAAGAAALLLAAPFVAGAPAPLHTTENEGEAPPTRATGSGRFTLPLIAYAAIGFAALVFEVGWTRTLSMILGSSTYAFATMLAGFLAGIALGSLLIGRWLDRVRDPLRPYAFGALLLGVSGVGVILAFRRLPDLFLHVFAIVGISSTALAWLGLAVSFAVMLVPTLVLGALFPLLVRVVAEQRAGGHHPDAVGDVYFTNTIGSALGAFCAGFVLIPLLGLERSLAVGSGLALATGAALLWWRSRRSGQRYALLPLLCALAAVGVALRRPTWDRGRLALGAFYRSSSQLDFGLPAIPMPGVAGDELLYYREGINGTVSVHHTAGGIEEGGIALRINGKTDASLADMSTQILSGHIPFWFGGNAERVLVIGYASGVTTGAATLYSPSRIDVCEIEPAVIEASHWFDDYNHRPLERDDVHLIVEDGRSYLSYTGARYDVVISEPSNPWITGCANLFTAEFFAVTHRALRPGGRLLQWVQLYGMSEAGLRTILAALHRSFRYAYGFLVSRDNNDLLLVATDTELELGRLARWEQLPAAAREDLARLEVLSTADLWSLLLLLPEPLAELAAGAPAVNTDDSMFVELDAPWHLYEDDPHTLQLLVDHARGVVPLLQGSTAVSDELIGELAISYLERRHLPELGDAACKLLEQHNELGLLAAYEAERILTGAGEGTNRDAARLLELAVARSGGFAAYYGRGWLRNQTGHYTAALGDLERALELHPGHYEARHQRMKGLAQLGRTEQAASECRALLASAWAEADERLWAEDAYLSAQTGDLRRATASMRRYLELVPYSPREWQLQADWLQRLGKAAQAKQAGENVELAQRNAIRQLHWEARWKMRFGDPADAIPLLERILKADPHDSAAAGDLQRLREEGRQR